MNIIKLDAIDSTNLYLKEYSRNIVTENFTTVVTDHQTNGRGQVGSSWISEKGKNLTFSTFIKNKIKNPNEIFDLNCIITTTLITVLEKLNLTDLHIKWPNDILSANKKIAGILIENSIKSNGEIQSIIGIGLNVNQINFENTPKASSIHLLTGKEFDKNELLISFLKELELSFNTYDLMGSKAFWLNFHNNLYQINKPSLFVNNSNNEQFSGIIKGVNQNGLLEIELPNNTIQKFGLKEITMLY